MILAGSWCDSCGVGVVVRDSCEGLWCVIIVGARGVRRCCADWWCAIRVEACGAWFLWGLVLCDSLWGLVVRGSSWKLVVRDSCRERLRQDKSFFREGAVCVSCWGLVTRNSTTAATQVEQTMARSTSCKEWPWRL